MPSALLCENTLKCRRFGFLHEAKASQKAEKTAAKPLNECGCVLTLPSLFHSTNSTTTTSTEQATQQKPSLPSLKMTHHGQLGPNSCLYSWTIDGFT